MIGSHVIYERKNDGLPKPRIAPWGHRDVDKDDVRGNSPSLSFDSIHLLLSLADETRWRAKKLDVKSAYSQAKSFSQDIYIRPPREENDSKGLWKRIVPIYDLTNSKHLWSLTSYEARTKKLRLNRSKI